MPFQRPTLQELRDRVALDYASRLGLSSLLPRSVLLALANADAASGHLLHGHLAYLARQHFPQTAEREGLLRLAELRGVTRKSAAYATGAVTLQGVAGTTVAGGALLRRADGATFALDAAATLGLGGTVDAAVTAASAGALGDCAPGTELQFTSPTAGVSSVALVAAAGVSGGADAETDEELRARVLARFKEPILGGAKRDWVTWALQFPGVTRAWCLPNVNFPGSVGVGFAVDDASYGPIPTSGDVALLAAYLEQFRPVVSQLFVFAPLPLAVDVTLQLTPNTPEVQVAVEASLRDLVRREGDLGGTLYLSHLHEAVSLATGELDHVIVSPTADVVATPGYLHVPGVVSFT